MPTYEYRCKSCGHELEVQQSFTDDPLTECPECQGALRKVFGNIAVTFKGSGFYKTDSRSASKSTSSSSESSSDSKSEKSDTKTEPKTEKSESSSTKSESKKPDSTAAAS